MASSFTNVLSPSDIAYIQQLPEVVEAKSRVDATNSGMINCTITLTDSIRSALATRFGLDLTTVHTIPMRWVKGDTAPHVDVGSARFDHTHLVYLSDSAGALVIDGAEYPIQENTGYIFAEGVSHATCNTGATPRLVLGPMSNQAFRVGNIKIEYYSGYPINYPDNYLASNNETYVLGDVTTGSIGSYVAWKVDPENSNGVFNAYQVYRNGHEFSQSDTSGNMFYYSVYAVNPCFLEGTQILCLVNGVDTYVPIEKMTTDTLVKTSRDGYKKVDILGSGTIHNPGTADRSEHRLYKCSPSKYPELTSDLYITGCHSILVDELTETQRSETKRMFAKVFVTDKKYRLAASIDTRAEPWASEGVYTIWHFALEHENEKMNYGVYANGGLLVESCCKSTMRTLSNITCR